MTSHEPHTERARSYTSLALPEPAIRTLLTVLGHEDAAPTVSELRLAVCERVRVMRDDGHHPEVVLSRIKQLTASALNDAQTPHGMRSGEATALLAQVGQWCIAEYFRQA